MNKHQRPTIMAQCLVCNEENWVWYAINSVIDYMDKILVYDTGSTDRTVEIIKAIKSPKIEIHKKGKVDPEGFTRMRQEMLDKTDTDWFLILDGDDIWPEETIAELREKIDHAPLKKEAVVVGFWSCVGDVFHYSSEVARLKFPKAPEGVLGWMSTRAMRRNVCSRCIGIHGNQGYVDQNGIGIGRRCNDNMIFLKGKYFHMSYLPRSSSRKKDREVVFRGQKTRFVRGAPFPKEIKYPEVFYLEKPDFVPSPWKRMTWWDELKGFYYRAENFFERLKRRDELKGLAH